jgi:hypothetical protein
MKTTFILKDFSDVFYDGSESIVGLLTMPDNEKFKRLTKMANEKRITMKIGDGSFRDRVELNQITRTPCRYTFKLEPRRGYKLATFEITA